MSIYIGAAIGPKGVGSGICVGKPGPRFFRPTYSAFGAKDALAFTPGVVFSAFAKAYDDVVAGTTGPAFEFVRNTTGHLIVGTKKYQAELTFQNGSGPAQIGIAEINYPYKAGSASSISNQAIFAGLDGATLWTNFTGARVSQGAATAPSNGDHAQIVLDQVAQTLSIYVNGVLSGSAINLNALTLGNAGQPTMCIAVGLSKNLLDEWTLNTGATPFVNPIAGAVPWK